MHTPIPSLPDRAVAGGPSRALTRWWVGLDEERRRKAIGLALAIGIEGLILLALMSLGVVTREPVPMSDAVATFDVGAASTPDEAEPEPEPKPEPSSDAVATFDVGAASTPDEAEPEPELEPASDAAPAPRQPVRPTSAKAPEQPAPIAQPTQPPSALLRVDSATMRAADIARVPSARPVPGAQAIGPAFTPRPGDSQRIAGSGPNGEPLYAARWYREPTDGELAGYLSTATAPGWGLINCQTAPQFRVENCVLVDEFPDGANIGRAVLAAAWQFKVRPPQIGGQPQVGEWVRIRIDYGVRRSP